VKKTPGKGTANNKDIRDNIQKHKADIHSQISILDPTHIICCLKHDGLTDELFDKPEHIQTGCGRPVFVWNGIRVIDFYHPSGFTAPAAFFALMKEIVTSMVFRAMKT